MVGSLWQARLRIAACQSLLRQWDCESQSKKVAMSHSNTFLLPPIIGRKQISGLLSHRYVLDRSIAGLPSRLEPAPALMQLQPNQSHDVEWPLAERGPSGCHRLFAAPTMRLWLTRSQVLPFAVPGEGWRR